MNMDKEGKAGYRNPTFSFLQALAILMVIDDHVGTRIGILSSIFPYNSFYMPLFVFFSGYFYKERNIKNDIIHRFRRLMIPYLIYSVIGELIALLLSTLGVVNWQVNITVGNIFKLLTDSPLSSINGAAWFVCMLFWVSITYNLIHKLFFKKENDKIFDLAFLIISMILGFLVVEGCIKGYFIIPNIETVYRLIFYIQFFHIGVIFKKHIEERLKQTNKMIVCSICVAINVVLVCTLGKNIEFVSTMRYFSKWYLPLITSMTGIIFWYEIMHFLAEKVGTLKLVDFISRNTATIMEVHLFFANIPNFIIYFMIKGGSNKFDSFHIEQFKESAWYKYNDSSKLIGFFCALIGSLLICWVIEYIRSATSYKKDKHGGKVC